MVALNIASTNTQTWVFGSDIPGNSTQALTLPSGTGGSILYLINGGWMHEGVHSVTTGWDVVDGSGGGDGAGFSMVMNNPTTNPNPTTAPTITYSTNGGGSGYLVVGIRLNGVCTSIDWDTNWSGTGLNGNPFTIPSPSVSVSGEAFILRMICMDAYDSTTNMLTSYPSDQPNNRNSFVGTSASTQNLGQFAIASGTNPTGAGTVAASANWAGTTAWEAAATTLELYGTPAGGSPNQGTATFPFNFELTGAGRRVAGGTATFPFNFQLLGAGSRPAGGVASFPFDFALTSTGQRVAGGTAAFPFDFALTAAGARAAGGVAEFPFNFDLDAEAARMSEGAGTFGFTFGLEAESGSARTGDAVFDYNFDLSAAGVRAPGGNAVFDFSFGVAAAGERSSDGLAVFGFGFDLTASGGNVPSGVAAFPFSFALTAEGAPAQRAGLAEFFFNFALDAIGHMTPIAPILRPVILVTVRDSVVALAGVTSSVEPGASTISFIGVVDSDIGFVRGE